MAILETLFAVYDRLPRRLKSLLAFMLKPVYALGARTMSIISAARVPAFLFEGKEKGTGDALSVLTVSHHWTANFLSGLIYSGTPSCRSLGHVFIWKARLQRRKHPPEADLTFVETDGFFSPLLKRQNYMLIPQWVMFVLDISKPMKEIRRLFNNRSMQNNIRKIKKHQYTFEVTQDPGKFDFFYSRMYLPYAEKRFEKTSLKLGYRQMKRVAEKGKLLLVKKEDELLAGNLMREEGKNLFAHSLGIRDGDVAYLDEGALTAAYYFTIHWAKANGYQRIDFGYCRPFFQDGIFIHKKRWGMELKKHDGAMGRGIIGINIEKFSPAGQSFFVKNPLIFKDRDRLRGLILADKECPLDAGDVERLVKINRIKGLDGLIINNPRGFTSEARRMRDAALPLKLVLADMDADAFLRKLMGSKL